MFRRLLSIREGTFLTGMYGGALLFFVFVISTFDIVGALLEIGLVKVGTLYALDTPLVICVVKLDLCTEPVGALKNEFILD